MNKTQLYQTNLCKEILILSQRIQCTLDTMSFDTRVFYAPFKPEHMIKPKYKFSRKWYVADFHAQNYDDVRQWCKEQFGPEPKFPDAWSRWQHRYEHQIFFRDEKDYVLFLLRWGV